MPHNNIPPPRDLEGLRKWRAERYAEKKTEEYERHIDQLVNRPVTPRKRVAPTLKKKAVEPGRFPLIGSRAKGKKGQTQEGEKGYVE